MKKMPSWCARVTQGFEDWTSRVFFFIISILLKEMHQSDREKLRWISTDAGIYRSLIWWVLQTVTREFYCDWKIFCDLPSLLCFLFPPQGVSGFALLMTPSRYDLIQFALAAYSLTVVSGEVLTRLEAGAPIVDAPHRQIRHCYGWLTVNEAGGVCVGTMREGGSLTVLSKQYVGGASCLNYAFTKLAC